MGLTNLIITVAGVSAVILLLRSDVKQSAAVFRRNVKHIRNWLEEESAAASKWAPPPMSLWVEVIMMFFRICSKAWWSLLIFIKSNDFWFWSV